VTGSGIGPRGGGTRQDTRPAVTLGTAPALRVRRVAHGPRVLHVARVGPAGSTRRKKLGGGVMPEGADVSKGAVVSFERRLTTWPAPRLVVGTSARPGPVVGSDRPRRRLFWEIGPAPSCAVTTGHGGHVGLGGVADQPGRA